MIPVDRSALGTPRRWVVLVFGMSCLVAGISLSITAELGVGSWQVFETGLVDVTGGSFGVVVFVESVILLGVAWVWLRQKLWIATGILAFAGIAIGALLEVLSTPTAVAGQYALLAAGMVLIAVGVAFYLASDLGASAQDALFVGIYQRYPVRPGVVRFVMDASLVFVGIALGGQFGVGTFAVTLAVPLLIEPALRLGHRLAGTPLPEALER